MEDLEGLSLRELVTLARERLGAAASALKTRDELTTALGALVTVHPERSRGATFRTVGHPSLDSAGDERLAGLDVVTRDFFQRREG